MRTFLYALLINTVAFYVVMLLAHSAVALPVAPKGTKPVLADLQDLKALGIPALKSDQASGVGFTYISPETEERLHEFTHSKGKCGSFESLESFPVTEAFLNQIFQDLDVQNQKNITYLNRPFRMASVERKPEIEKALNEVKEENVHDWVTWLSSFHTRFNKGPNANEHVMALKQKLEALVKQAAYPVEVSLIDHHSTPQKSLRVHITGRTRPDEIIVLGGHLDSINMRGAANPAPGADDNASGSADLLEALRIALKQPQPERTVEFFWYAGEESGLLGSAEIAADYKSKKRDVIAVLQLDMTLFPGEGEFVIGNIEDNTSAWLHDYLKSMNSAYLNARIISDECGYACSDHASWHRNGYPALMPFESSTDRMNHSIHSMNDIIGPESNFKHATAFAKIALVFALDLANSTDRSPL